VVLVVGLPSAACSRKGEVELALGPPAPNTENRSFAISVDGKRAGTYHMEITRRNDGGLTMSGRARVRVSYVVYTYRYAYTGTEIYKGGRLSSLTSTCDDNGKRFTVAAGVQHDGLHITVNGTERVTQADVWTTSYWRLPPGDARDRRVFLLDADTGKTFPGRLQHVGEARLEAAEQMQACTHYRVTGGASPVDLWYDGQQRLVRQEYLEDGHRTVLELTHIARGKAEAKQSVVRGP
jgi:hypothetical protein